MGSVSNAVSQSHNASDATQFGSNVWENQRPFLQDLYVQSQNMSRGPDAGAMQRQLGLSTLGESQAAYGQSMGQLGDSNQAYLGSLGQIGAGNQMFGQSAQNLQQMANPNQTDPMMDIYARQLGQQLNQNILPQMRGEAAQAGQLGSSRAGIGQGVATAQVGQQLQDFAGQLYAGQQERALAANQGLQQAGQGYQQGGQLMQQIGQGFGQNAGLMQGAAQGFGQNAQLYGQASQLEQAAPWYNMQQYGALVGGPAMRDLGGQSTSRARSYSHSGSFSMGGMG